jgi:hypothetical protein
MLRLDTLLDKKPPGLSYALGVALRETVLVFSDSFNQGKQVRKFMVIAIACSADHKRFFPADCDHSVGHASLYRIPVD